MGQCVLGLAGPSWASLAPPLRPNLDSSFISCLSGGSVWLLSSVPHCQLPHLAHRFSSECVSLPNFWPVKLSSLDSQDSKKKVFKDVNTEPNPFKGRLQFAQPLPRQVLESLPAPGSPFSEVIPAMRTCCLLPSLPGSPPAQSPQPPLLLT